MLKFNNNNVKFLYSALHNVFQYMSQSVWTIITAAYRIRKLPLHAQTIGGAKARYSKQLPIYTWVEWSNNSARESCHDSEVGN